MTKNIKRGDFLFDIKTYDINEGTILDRRKIKGSKTDWAEFLEKFGIPFTEDDKRTTKSKQGRRKRSVLNTEPEDCLL